MLAQACLASMQRGPHQLLQFLRVSRAILGVGQDTALTAQHAHVISPAQVMVEGSGS